jgi:hypothetical protein
MRVGRGFPPVVGTIYMPVSVPLMGCGGGRGLEGTADEDHNPLRTAHVAELSALRNEQARAALKAEVEASQRVLDRMGSVSSVSAPPTSADLDKRLKDLNDQLTKLTDRVSTVERMSLTHDKYLEYLREERQLKPDQMQKPMPELVPGPKGR